jgi:hypothetical protein
MRKVRFSTTCRAEEWRMGETAISSSLQLPDVEFNIPLTESRPTNSVTTLSA